MQRQKDKKIPCTHSSIPLLNAGGKHGAGEGNRTPDLLITSQLLYHLSYTGKKECRTLCLLAVYRISPKKIKSRTTEMLHSLLFSLLSFLAS